MSPGRGVQISHLAYGDNDSAGWSWSKFAASDRLSADRSWKDVDVFVDDLLMRRHARAANSSYRISGWLFPRRLSPARRNLHSFSHLTFPSQEINSCHLTFPATTIQTTYKHSVICSSTCGTRVTLPGATCGQWSAVWAPSGRCSIIE